MLHQPPARHSSWRSPRATTSFRMRSLVASIGEGYTKGALKSFKCRCKYTSGVRSASFLATPDNRSTQPPRFQMPPRSVLTHPFVFISLQTPFAATPLFSHPSKSPGGVPSRRSCIPTSQTLPAAVKPFTAYHIPATPAVSCNYTLFRAATGRYPSYSQQLPHSFYRHGGGTPLPHLCGLLCSDLSALCVALFPAFARLRRHMRLMHPEWIYGMRHVAPLSPAPSVYCAYFPSPRGCTPQARSCC